MTTIRKQVNNNLAMRKAKSTPSILSLAQINYQKAKSQAKKLQQKSRTMKKTYRKRSHIKLMWAQLNKGYLRRFQLSQGKQFNVFTN